MIGPVTVNHTSLPDSFDLCDLCALDSPSTIACQDCKSQLCELHKYAHMATKQTMNHILIPKEQLQFLKEAKAESDTEIFNKSCNNHPRFIADKFCNLCSKICCSECAFMKSHSMHKQEIVLLSECIPELIQDFQRVVIPSTAEKLSALIEMKKKVSQWEVQLEEIHNQTIQVLELEFQEIKNEFENQKEFLETAYANTKQGLAYKMDDLDIRIESAHELIRQFNHSIQPKEFSAKFNSFEQVQCDMNDTEDTLHGSPTQSESGEELKLTTLEHPISVNNLANYYSFPSNKEKFDRLITIIGSPSESEILTNINQKDLPTQYPILKKLPRPQIDQNFSLLKTIDSITKNPLKKTSIDYYKQYLFLDFQFEDFDFKNLGFSYTPEIKLLHQFECIECRKHLDSLKKTISYDSMIGIAENVIEYVYHVEKDDWSDYRVKGEMMSNCEHKMKWKACRTPVNLVFTVFGQEFRFELNHELCVG